MTGNSQQRRRLRHISWRFFFSKGHLLLIFVVLQIKIIHIYLSMSRAIDRVFHNPVENSSRGHPCTPRKFLPFSSLPPRNFHWPSVGGGGGGIWLFSGITHLKVFINEPSFQTNFVVANKKSESVPENNLIAFWHRMKQEAKTVILLYFRKSHMNWVKMLWKWMS